MGVDAFVSCSCSSSLFVPWIGLLGGFGGGGFSLYMITNQSKASDGIYNNIGIFLFPDSLICVRDNSQS